MLQKTISPIDGSVVVERAYTSGTAIDEALARGRREFRAWKATPLETRIAILSRAVDCFARDGAAIAEEITLQMGRPIAQSPGEIRGFEERARYMLEIAPAALAPEVPTAKAGFERSIQHEPLGVVLVVAPWNYPYLTAVNSIWPALAAGNAVLLKHASQTPLCGERLETALLEAGLPQGVLQNLVLTHDDTARLAATAGVDLLCFTGSVPGGAALQQAMAHRFAGSNMELGGKDPAYVRADADPVAAAESLVDGACFNSGQSCCGIERIYVHEALFDSFTEAYREVASAYVLDDPRLATTTLGPMVRASAADLARGQVDEALRKGARALIDETRFTRERPGSPYKAPQALIDVDHSMGLMREESFAPVVGIMKVASDKQALALMNDSSFGLTASIWTKDIDAARRLATDLETGTVYANRCDYLDPALAWVGVKQSGRGCTLSHLGYQQLTRPKSLHFRLP